MKQNVAIRRVREKQVLRLCNFDKNVFFCGIIFEDSRSLFPDRVIERGLSRAVTWKGNLD